MEDWLGDDLPRRVRERHFKTESSRAFGRAVREARLAKGLSIEDGAKLVGITPSYLSDTEQRGHGKVPNRKTIRAIAEAFDVDEIELLTLALEITTDPRRWFNALSDDEAADLRLAYLEGLRE